jgi:integrase/recombinase XerD
VQDIGPLDVRDYLEAAKANGLSTATLKQHMAAIRMLFDHLVTGGVIEHNPALSVKAPRQKLGKGKTAVLTAEEAGELLRSIESDSVWGYAIAPSGTFAGVFGIGTCNPVTD